MNFTSFIEELCDKYNCEVDYHIEKPFITEQPFTYDIMEKYDNEVLLIFDTDSKYFLDCANEIAEKTEHISIEEFDYHILYSDETESQYDRIFMWWK